MKQRLTFLLLALSLGLNAQTIFVKASASGANDGSSWLNAYTSLDAALTAAASGGNTVWVAAGTYKPGAQLTFLLSDGMKIYGGFAGTETSLGERNIAANTTILSGDILGNDIPGNFAMNRVDNAQHVVTCVELVSNPGIVVDGFTIKGGQTLNGSANTDLTRRGGGIQIIAKAAIRNCTFEDNYAESGAGIAALDALSAGFEIQNCTFQNNKAEAQAALFLRGTPNATIKKCNFIGNTVNRGSLYPSGCTGLKIDSCLFQNNNAGGNFGAALFSYSSSWDMTNCIFMGNKATNAAGLYIDDRDGGHMATLNHCLFEADTVTGFGGAGIYGWQASFSLKNTIFRKNYSPDAAAIYCNGGEFDSSFSIDSCLFDSNKNTDYGATFWGNKVNYTMSNCIFTNNVAPSSGAAIYHGDTTIFTITNCLFQANTGNYAAAIANYGIGCEGTFEGCTFSENLATNGGGAASNGFKANVTYSNCQFIGNQAAFGGAIFTQNDTTQLHIKNCYFNNNITTGSGGCIVVNSNIKASIEGTTFFQNYGDMGAAISATGDSLLTLDRCKFIENFATTQGAALNLSHVNCEMTNCLFARNFNSGDGAGGAISNNASNGEISAIKAVNCTFADNNALLGAGIAQWEESDSATSQLTLLNCLFKNADGDNYSIEAGTPDVISLGGNQSGDATLGAYLIATKDANNSSNDFVDPDNNDYHPAPGAPAINGGLANGAPATDVDGVTRNGTPDSGCFETNTVGAHTPDFQLLTLACSPNPASDRTVVSLNNQRNGQVTISVWNQAGQKVAEYQAEKTATEFSFPMTVNTLPAGAYQVRVQLGAIVHQGRLVKM